MQAANNKLNGSRASTTYAPSAGIYDTGGKVYLIYTRQTKNICIYEAKHKYIYIYTHLYIRVRHAVGSTCLQCRVHLGG